MTEVIETGLEPEFHITDLAWWEPVAGGAAVRMCFAGKRHGRLVAQYLVVISLEDLERIRGEHNKLREELIKHMMMPLNRAH